MYAGGFRIYFTPLPGFFSPFPHGTGSLSVDHEYLALEDGPPIFKQDFSCPALLIESLVPLRSLHLRGYHPLWLAFPGHSVFLDAIGLWAAPGSLAATAGISVDFFSCSYLDVSVRCVRFLAPMYSVRDSPCGVGSPIQISADHCLFASSPQLFAGCRVFLRL